MRGLIRDFGKCSADRFYEENGADGAAYLKWLMEKAGKDLSAAVHIWESAHIIGQMELGTFKDDPSVGYVNLYYLLPEKRGKGYSKYLDDYAGEFFSEKGLSSALLSVSPTNKRAISFYEKMDWRNMGPRPGREEVSLMKKQYKRAF